jgi:hypothetical protein
LPWLQWQRPGISNKLHRNGFRNDFETVIG